MFLEMKYLQVAKIQSDVRQLQYYRVIEQVCRYRIIQCVNFIKALLIAVSISLKVSEFLFKALLPLPSIVTVGYYCHYRLLNLLLGVAFLMEIAIFPILPDYHCQIRSMDLNESSGCQNVISQPILLSQLLIQSIIYIHRNVLRSKI